jgi:hypothetical protein
VVVNTEGRELARRQSAALAAALGLPGAPGQPSAVSAAEARPARAARVQGGTLTWRERRMLGALAAVRNGATPDELIAAHPGWFSHLDLSGQPGMNSARAGLHLTGASLVRKGLASRGRRQVPARDGGVQGGARLYRITEAGRQAR